MRLSCICWFCELFRYYLRPQRYSQPCKGLGKDCPGGNLLAEVWIIQLTGNVSPGLGIWWLSLGWTFCSSGVTYPDSNSILQFVPRILYFFGNLNFLLQRKHAFQLSPFFIFSCYIPKSTWGTNMLKEGEVSCCYCKETAQRSSMDLCGN